MGCDIHAHIEVKIDGVWHHWDQPRIDRNYNMFARLAGARNYGCANPLSKNRGLPDDASYIVRFHAEHWGRDGHSHGYINAKELAELYNQFLHLEIRKELQFGFLFGMAYPSWIEYPEDRPDGIEDVRMVFWFDN